MDDVLHLKTSLTLQPISYQLTLHKLRLDKYYNDRGSTFNDEFELAKRGISSSHHMYNLIGYYGEETIQYFLDTFFGKKVG